MTLLSHYIVVLIVSCQCSQLVWSSNIHKQVYYGHASSEEELNIGFKTSNAQYYNSREAHGDILDVVDGTNVTEHYFTNSDENSKEEVPGSISTILQSHHDKQGNKYPYPLKIGSQYGHDLSKYDVDNVRINLDISDYLEALSDEKESANEQSAPYNIREYSGQTQQGVIFAEHRYSVPLSNSHLSSLESEETVRYAELTSVESEETTESWALLTDGQTRIRPGVPQDFNTTEVSLPKCSGAKKQSSQCNGKEQNLCRSTGDCRIARIWGTCCNAPDCGSYCQRNGSKCPHPNSIKLGCDDGASYESCSQLHDDCPGKKSCCQTPCGYRCV